MYRFTLCTLGSRLTCNSVHNLTNLNNDDIFRQIGNYIITLGIVLIVQCTITPGKVLLIFSCTYTYCFGTKWFLNIYIYCLHLAIHAILVHITRVNLEDNGTKVVSVRDSPGNLGGRDSTKMCTVQFQVYFNLKWIKACMYIALLFDS